MCIFFFFTILNAILFDAEIGLCIFQGLVYFIVFLK